MTCTHNPPQPATCTWCAASQQLRIGPYCACCREKNREIAELKDELRWFKGLYPNHPEYKKP